MSMKFEDARIIPGHQRGLVTKFGKIGLPGGLPPPRPPGPGASGANRGGAAFGRRPPILGTPVGAGAARSGGSGGREPPQEGQPPRIMLPSCAGGRVLQALPHILSRPSSGFFSKPFRWDLAVTPGPGISSPPEPFAFRQNPPLSLSPQTGPGRRAGSRGWAEAPVRKGGRGTGEG